MGGFDSAAPFVARLEAALLEVVAFSRSPDIPDMSRLGLGNVADRSNGKRVMDWSEFLSVLDMGTRTAWRGGC